jgi:beta-alanine--pyruvate transaminase
MPFTANRAFKAQPRLLASAEGVHYSTSDGRRVLDGASGLFCVPAGHGRPEIAEAIARQLRTLDYAPPFQFGHPEAFALAREVAGLTPPGLDRIFFVNSGSEAVETALKAALVYHRARGEAQRVRFVGRERAYHGVNFGGVAVGGMVRNREAYGAGLAGVDHLRHTLQPGARFTRGQPAAGADLADDLQRIVDLHGAASIAACIVEPVCGSAGILVPPVGYLERLRQICDRHGILLIFDEVICGFGRTGAPFAAQRFGVTPDIITMAKALTNGCVPMGAVAFRTGIYEAVTAAAPEGAIEFPHGYTYSSHPIACAAARATLRIYREEGLFERAAALSEPFQEAIFSLQGIGVVTDIRSQGLLAGIELAEDGAPGRRGYRVIEKLFAAGLLVRVTADTVILAPPFVMQEAQLQQIAELLRKVLATE